jgi:hypothetical protein
MDVDASVDDDEVSSHASSVLREGELLLEALPHLIFTAKCILDAEEEEFLHPFLYMLGEKEPLSEGWSIHPVSINDVGGAGDAVYRLVFMVGFGDMSIENDI